MKRSLHTVVFSLFLFIQMNVSAQVYQLDGMDFENWNQNYYNALFPSNYYWENQPTSLWASSNAATTIVNDFCCERTTDCSGGSYAARLETKSIFGTPAAGNIFTGYFIADMFNSKAMRGVPFTDQPESMTGNYKYSPANYNNGTATVPDTCAIYAILSRWDGMQRVEIARAELYSSQLVSNYSPFVIYFNYISTDIPDTISVVCASSKYGDLFKGGIGSTLLVDDLQFQYSIGYAEENSFSHVWTDNETWVFEFRTDSKRHVTIYDAKGGVARSESISGKSGHIHFNDLPAGIYFYNIVEGNKSFEGKLIK